MKDHNHLTIKTFMAITAERDAAIRERNMALEERKRAFAERDMAMLQRDAAIAERNAAIQERDEALASLQYRDSSMNENTTTIPIGTQDSLKRTFSASDVNDTQPPENPKPKKGRPTKHGKATTSSKSPRIVKRAAESPGKQVSSNTYDSNNGWVNESDEEYLEKPEPWKDNLGLNQINFDESAMPVPVCTCTGAPQPCYRWGNGGWQSACCTTTISMYPLPQVANKRYSRVGGRKMSGSAFGKLLNRLAAEGYDFSSPLDLKDHWAKHGTNRYSTLK